MKSLLPSIKAGLPPALKIDPLSDQSIFVKASITGVIREGLIAACLTGFMILVFLGSWRSTLIIAVSIPLSILTSIIVMSALGETINIMTLGGLALAVGILVDDATVEIENINRNIDQGKEIVQAILDGASQIAVPALVSTLSICIVFVPMFFLTGVARYLFVPLAEAVSFAMLASYLLSRTIVPTMARYLLADNTLLAEGNPQKKPHIFSRMQQKFEHGFEGLRDRYHGVLEICVRHNKLFAICFLGSLYAVLRAAASAGAGFFPGSRHRRIQAAPARSHRHPHRRNRGALRSRGSRDPQRNSAKRNSLDHRQHRLALQRYQPFLQQLRARLAPATPIFWSP